MSDSLTKFQRLLRELFQFDVADLDFGIYQIMNQKRREVERFISEDLPQRVAEALAHGTLAEGAQAAHELAEARKKVIDAFEDNVLDANGDFTEEMYSTSKPGKEYLAARAKAAGLRSRDALEALVYNHLFAFFSHYYQDGDFISKRRYSTRQERYAIPYNGEEVTLYWANRDQYYVKTAEYFTDYTFTAANGVTVHFKLRAADVEQNNVKGEKRFFVPRPAETAWDAAVAQLVIPFEFRPLTAQEAISYGGKNQQEAILARATADIPKRLSPVTAAPALAALSEEKRRTADGEPVTALAHHLRQYTRRNTSDFFIHKDLRGFLARELDFYLKNEVLSLDEMEAAGEGRAEGWFQIMAAIRAVGGRIIEFLAQVEEFQKMLWEKRKFITETFYCVTVGNVPEAFYGEIAACDAQWLEWRTLFDIEVGLTQRREDAERMAFLRTHPTLVVDTRHFDQPFVDRLLGSFDDLDEVTDGLLVHSENWQALNLLGEGYREQINCVYIDPPYNAASSEIVYKNSYKHSSWLTLIENRITRSLPLLNPGDCFAIAIDDYEMARLCELTDYLFGGFDRQMIVVNHHPQGGMSDNVSRTHEYMLVMTPEDSDVLFGKRKPDGFEFRSFMLSGPGANKSRSGRWRSFYAFLIDEKKSRIAGIEPPPPLGESYPTTNTSQGYVRRYPLSSSGEEKVWCRSFDSAVKALPKGEIVLSDSGVLKLVVNTTGKRSNLMSNWTDSKYNAGPHGTALLAEILGYRDLFSYPKSIYTVMDALEAMTWHHSEPVVLDYFAGSGTTSHAIINLNREDGGRRHFILVEMADYFDTVLLPRIKKVTYTPEWRDGKPKRMVTAEEAERGPRIVKVIRLESYEDSLNNIAFDAAAGQSAMQFEDDLYLLRYMLKWEARRSETLLDVEKLASPFRYTLHLHAGGQTGVKPVDIPETFNYLLGLHVQTRRTHDDDGRRYLVYRGAIDGRQVAVIWRETEGWGQADYERDRQFVAEHKLVEGADEVFVNGDSLIPGARALEPLFKARMFAMVEA